MALNFAGDEVPSSAFEKWHKLLKFNAWNFSGLQKCIQYEDALSGANPKAQERKLLRNGFCIHDMQTK